MPAGAEARVRKKAWELVGIPVGAAITLLWMGQPLWCKCGSPSPWSFQVMSMHNSQHLIDPYTFTHVLHGVVFFACTSLLASRFGLRARLALTLALEAVWEVAENTDAVIQRYREATISLDYFGDSVLNSVADLGACALGFAIARRLPWWGSLAVFLVTEVVLMAWIRDSLLLNVLMLVYPLDAVKAWQGGG